MKNSITYQAGKFLIKWTTKGDVVENTLGILLFPAYILFSPFLIAMDIACYFGGGK